MKVDLLNFFQENNDDSFIKAVRRTLFDESGCLRNEVSYSEFYALKNSWTEKYAKSISFSHPVAVFDPDSTHLGKGVPIKVVVSITISNKTYFYMFKEPIEDVLGKNTLIFIGAKREQ